MKCLHILDVLLSSTSTTYFISSPHSQRGEEPGAHGPQRPVRPLREAQADPRSQEREQAEDQDHQMLPQPHLERDLQLVRHFVIQNKNFYFWRCWKETCLF